MLPEVFHLGTLKRRDNKIACSKVDTDLDVNCHGLIANWEIGHEHQSSISQVMCQAAPRSIWRHFHNSATRFADLSRTATGLSRMTPSDESSMSQVFWQPSRGVRLKAWQ